MNRFKQHSLVWVGARAGGGVLVGSVNVASDGDAQAFLLDTTIRGSHQCRGVVTEIVGLAVTRARAAGCECLHVDFEPRLRPFCVAACGLRPINAGLILSTGELMARTSLEWDQVVSLPRPEVAFHASTRTAAQSAD